MTSTSWLGSVYGTWKCETWKWPLEEEISFWNQDFQVLCLFSGVYIVHTCFLEISKNFRLRHRSTLQNDFEICDKSYHCYHNSFLFLSQIMDIIWQDDFFGVKVIFVSFFWCFVLTKTRGKRGKPIPAVPPKACSNGRVCRSCRPTHGVDALTLLGCRGSWIRCWLGGHERKSNATMGVSSHPHLDPFSVSLTLFYIYIFFGCLEDLVFGSRLATARFFFGGVLEAFGVFGLPWST